MIRRSSLTAIAVMMMLSLGALLAPKAYAAAALVQSNYATGGSVSFNTPASAGDLIVAICSTNVAATITGPAGFSSAINESVNPSQAIFYKVAAGGESTIACTFSTGTSQPIQIFEFNGIEKTAPLDIINTATSSGTTASAASGVITNRNYNDLLITGITSDGTTAPAGWTNSFSQIISNTIGGKQSNRMAYGSADFSVSSVSSYSTTASVASGSSWLGQIAAFRIAPTPILSGDIVDASGTSVASPNLSMTSLNQSFACQTASGTLGTSAAKIRVTNTMPTDNLGWNLAIAASSSTWSDGSGHTYAYNNSSGTPVGCSAGQLTISPATQVITPEASPEYGCSNTGLSAGANTAMTGTTPVTLVSASSTASYYCYWDITNIGLSQQVPALQPAGAYNLALTITLTAL